MVEQPAARAAHPAPDGVWRFIGRALHAGSDQAIYDGLAGRTGLRRCAHNWCADCATCGSGSPSGHR